ncbi:AbrB/MazE/SpoVT family DNA-binding domain-containing protein [Apilactobacillus timberlakei]|uniref:AbrB/MazE/SpoVT family DNA-binding domain-containing protein n=1 Tax=Apilactobacillus timberlakei TaxID=2008380 RepID=UPI0015E87294|nr:AbrB family transcriptional regulator [Apilactobacillus timberlakei]
MISENISIKKWGNSQGIRLSNSILKRLGMKYPDEKELKLEVNDNGIFLSKKKDAIDELFENFDYEKYKNEAPIGEVDWGQAFGKEKIE